MVGRLPRTAVTDPASMPGAALERRSVALEAAGCGLGLRLHAGGDPVVALGARADRPLDGLVRADLGSPLLAVRGEELREAGGRARLIRAVHHGDRLAWELDARVQLGDRRVVPVLDLPEED